MITVNQSLYNDEGTILVLSDDDIQLEKEVCIITDFLDACRGVEVDNYFLDSDYIGYPIFIFSVYLKDDYLKNWKKILKLLDNNLMLYCKSIVYIIT